MSVPPEIMAANGGGKAPPPGMPPPGGAPGAPPTGGAPPGAAPMMNPQKPAGAQEGAKVDVLMAQKMLEKALSAFGTAGSEEGRAILKAITALAKAFGKEQGQTEELMPAEIKQLLQGLAGPGTPPKPAAPPPGGPPGAGGAPPPGQPPPQ